MKPIIGIVGHPYINKDDNLIFQTTKSLVNKVSSHGGIPIIICPTQIENYLNKKSVDINKLTFSEKKDLDEILDICDAIIKPGATRIYEYERYIYSYAFQKDIPYLGICAGMQLMAHYNNDTKNEKNESDIIHYSKNKYVHKIKIFSGTLLYKILGQSEIKVNSLHNYHITNSGINIVNAYCEDGIIEGIENPYKQFHLGLQWHPEGLDDNNSYNIFESLIDNATYYKKKIKKM